jgi:tRNA-(ms[2]io[6]A)-hydroxylase
MDHSSRLVEVDSRPEGKPGPQGDFTDLKAAAAQRACSHESKSSRPGEGHERHRFLFAVDSRAVLHLASETSPDWLPRACAHLDAVLLDHAHCEKKAAGAAIKLLFSYPHHRFLQEPLAELARDELDHFQQILAHLDARGVRYETLKPSPYGMALHVLTRRDEPGRLVDILLISALIEARSCERFQILADGLGEPELVQLYRSLLASEARHHGIYLELAGRLIDRESLDARLFELAQAEAEIVSAPCGWVRLHAG